MELFKPDFGLVFWMFVVLVLLCILLGKYAWPVIIKMMTERDFVAAKLTRQSGLGNTLFTACLADAAANLWRDVLHGMSTFVGRLIVCSFFRPKSSMSYKQL